MAPNRGLPVAPGALSRAQEQGASVQPVNRHSLSPWLSWLALPALPASLVPLRPPWDLSLVHRLVILICSSASEEIRKRFRLDEIVEGGQRPPRWGQVEHCSKGVEAVRAAELCLGGTSSLRLHGSASLPFSTLPSFILPFPRDN